MKRCLFALAALAVVDAASAQSSVTLFGVVDGAVSGYKNTSETPLGVSVSKSQTAVTSSGYNGTRLGFRGTEDLGGGLAANFWLEAGFNVDTGIGASLGGLSFNRRSTVSLSGAFGEVRLGRDYTPTFWNDSIYDPFTSNGVGINLIATANGGTALGVPNSGFQSNANYVRASNSIGYFLPPNLGGFYGQVMYAFNEKITYDPGSLTPPGAAAIVANPALATADNARVGGYVGGRFGYANGPLDIALAYGESTIGSNYFVGSTTTLDIWNLGASWDFNVVKLYGEYSNNKQNTKLAVNAFNPFGLSKPGANGGLVGATVPIGAGLIRASYAEVRYNNLPPSFFATQPKSDQFAIGYIYNLSKLTALYATTSYLRNHDGASLAVTGSPVFYTGTVPGGIGNAVPRTSIGYDLGMRVAF